MMPFDRAISLLTASADPESDILRTSAYWIPLQFVYAAMVRNGDLSEMVHIDKERKIYYWSKVRGLKKDKTVRVMIAQALYVWDEIKKQL